MTQQELLHFAHVVIEQSGLPVGSVSISPVGGGSINETCRLSLDGDRSFFLKVNSAASFPGMMEKERTSLAFIGRQHCINTPNVIGAGIFSNHQWLLLEWIEPGPRTDAFWDTFGVQLAHLHQVSHPHFGFIDDNFIGSLHQANPPTREWTDFLWQFRLAPQLTMARDQKLLTAQQVKGFEKIPALLPQIFESEKPALLHGDLWSGNFICDKSGKPVLIDPAIYFGHRSMDLAMSVLFGGFDSKFYEAYHYHFPLPRNYTEQWDMCNLYPQLVHLNLFGEGYLPGIIATLKKFGLVF